MTENNTPKVYKAIHNVLKALQVDKTGELPSNMGSGKYMTSEAITNEVKRLFVANDLILESNEEVAHLEHPDYGDKKSRFLITIRGVYRAIHVEDGSSLSFSGIGNGLGTGVAIAANIASTFALKNSLQRLFLISEAAVDAEGHTEQAPPKQNPAVANAQQAAAPAKTRSTQGNNATVEIKAMIDAGKTDRNTVNNLTDKFAKELGKEKKDVHPEVLAELRKQISE